MKRRSETPAGRLRRTERKLETANRRLARVREERRRAAIMRPIYRMVNMIGEVGESHFNKGD